MDVGHEIGSDNMSDDSEMRALYLKNLCMFYMQLQAKYLIPSSTIQMIVEEINSLNDIRHQHTKNEFKEVLATKTNLSETEIDSVLSCVEGTQLHFSCSSHLSTEYRRKQFFKKKFSYVQPQAISLGTDENRRDCYAQYIPLQDTLKAMLKDPVVWQECVKSQRHAAPTNVFIDFCDGSVFMSNDLFMEPGISLKLILYQEAFETVNPLRSSKRKHKILGVYTGQL